MSSHASSVCATGTLGMTSRVLSNYQLLVESLRGPQLGNTEGQRARLEVSCKSDLAGAAGDEKIIIQTVFMQFLFLVQLSF
ncbi:hypothetical protein [Caballeronia temeraria]|uniref:hypothetical protein n=1 Tax=Caballeronia temeraria TaxID=1777137 RepID=UPI0012FD38C8|nr:hypothetical protein [Caballeronia temeraria]